MAERKLTREQGRETGPSTHMDRIAFGFAVANILTAAGQALPSGQDWTFIEAARRAGKSPRMTAELLLNARS